MSLPKPVAWLEYVRDGETILGSTIDRPDGFWPYAPLFTAEQVAEFADSLLTDAEGWVTFRRELAEFRAAYCGAHTEEK